jgi:SAM-dependent methyltransferase
MMLGDDVCRVCGEHGLQTHLPEQAWPWQGKTYRLAHCTACGSSCSDPLPDDATLADYYKRHFDYRWYVDYFEAKLRDARLRASEYAPKLAGRRVLDYGGGLGYMSQSLRERGFDSLTFDPYANANDPGIGWDAVVGLHMLEHGNDPGVLVERMKARLRPGGTLLLAVPNFEALGYRRHGMAWVWAQPPIVHVVHFTEAGLRRLLERHGFCNIRSSYHERWDANRVADVERHGQSAYCDRIWGLQPLNRFAAYRRTVARWNGRRRFAALALAERMDGPPAERAELEIVATLSEDR